MVSDGEDNTEIMCARSQEQLDRPILPLNGMLRIPRHKRRRADLLWPRGFQGRRRGMGEEGLHLNII